MLQKQFIVHWEEGHVAKSKVQMEAGRARTEGSRYYGNIGQADAPVLQFSSSSVLVTVCIVTGVEVREARCRFGQYREQELGQEGGELLYF